MHGHDGQVREVAPPWAADNPKKHTDPHMARYWIGLAWHFGDGDGEWEGKCSEAEARVADGECKWRGLPGLESPMGNAAHGLPLPYYHCGLDLQKSLLSLFPSGWQRR